MPMFLLIVGAIFLIASVRGEDETAKLLALIKGDFTGPNNFFFWAIAIYGVGALGYVPELRPLSRAFVALVIIRLLLSHADGAGNFFTKFMEQISATQTPQSNPVTAPANNADPLGFTLPDFSSRNFGSLTQ